MSSFRLYFYHPLAMLMSATRMFALKRVLLRWSSADIWRNVWIVSSAKFFVEGGLEIGDNTWIGHEAMIVGGDALVRIGKDVDIAPRVNLITGTRAPLGLTGKAAGTGCSRPITIGDGAWIGAAATILGGVMIGQESIVAAGALVRSNVSAKTIVAGVPARLVSVKESRC